MEGSLGSCYYVPQQHNLFTFESIYLLVVSKNLWFVAMKQSEMKATQTFIDTRRSDFGT